MLNRLIMDVLLSKLRDNFSCVSSCNKPIVVNCVPGSGKSHFIRTLVSGDSRFRAYTGGVPDFQNLTGRYLRKFEGSVDPQYINILDEYQVIDSVHYPKFAVIFGDPLQEIPKPSYPQASFVGNITRRFGKETALYLSKLGVDITSEREDKLDIEYIFSGKLVGVVIAFEEEVVKLLNSHGCPFRRPQEVRGETFDRVTFVCTGRRATECERHLVYIALTRHRDQLKILTADVTNTARGLF
uniref:Triple gene block protein 1 n=1 Tax=Sweet potato chlorotic fleck virus TaxID=263004 RepID=A0A0D3RLU1_9VIRU|nr:triple gene block protein 1 [Sweet potato chlorotic fleck virus]